MKFISDSVQAALYDTEFFTRPEVAIEAKAKLAKRLGDDLPMMMEFIEGINEAHRALMSKIEGKYPLDPVLIFMLSYKIAISFSAISSTLEKFLSVTRALEEKRKNDQG